MFLMKFLYAVIVSVIDRRWYVFTVFDGDCYPYIIPSFYMESPMVCPFINCFFIELAIHIHYFIA